MTLSGAARGVVDALTRGVPPSRWVVLITGPPCAGKTTLASRAAPGDVVADFDAECRALGSTSPGWDHPWPIRQAANQRMEQLFDRVAAMKSGRAWVIRSVPEATAREALADRLRADRVILLKPPTNVLMRRALERPGPHGVRREIRRWLARYTPSARDEVLESADDFRP